MQYSTLQPKPNTRTFEPDLLGRVQVRPEHLKHRGPRLQIEPWPAHPLDDFLVSASLAFLSLCSSTAIDQETYSSVLLRPPSVCPRLGGQQSEANADHLAWPGEELGHKSVSLVFWCFMTFVQTVAELEPLDLFKLI